MSAPKQLAKRKRLEKKRLRKQKQAIKRKNKKQYYQGPYVECFSNLDDPLFDEPLFFARGPVNGVKMSDVMADFITPWIDTADSLASYERLISMAQAAWNIALEPERLRNAALVQTVENRMPKASMNERIWCRDFLESMVDRKLEQFHAYKRRIIGFHAEDLGDQYHLTVISTLE